MWRKIAMVILMGLSIGLYGCKDHKEIIEPHGMTDEILESMNRITEQGLYAINSPEEEMVLYQGIDKGIKTMSYAVEENILKIHFETEDINLPRTHVYQITSDSSFDTIQVIIDGEEEAFINVFIYDQ